MVNSNDLIDGTYKQNTYQVYFILKFKVIKRHFFIQLFGNSTEL